MDQHTTAPLDALVDAVVGLGGPLTSIVSHMTEWQASGRSAPDAPPIPEVLASLLGSVLGDLAHDTHELDLRTAARVLERVTEVMCAELLIVDPSMGDGG